MDVASFWWLEASKLRFHGHLKVEGAQIARGLVRGLVRELARELVRGPVRYP